MQKFLAGQEPAIYNQGSTTSDLSLIKRVLPLSGKGQE